MSPVTLGALVGVVAVTLLVLSGVVVVLMDLVQWARAHLK